MSIVLFRVDERLIHGQVVVGWGERLNADRIVVIDDEIAHSAWEQELYCLGVPPSMEASFTTVADACRMVPLWNADSRRVIVLVRAIAPLEAIAEGDSLANIEVNLGGLHHAPGRERVLPYLFLSTDDRQSLRRIGARGITVTARDLPTTRPVPLSELVGDG
jgi:mannose/fructose/N-acetylgalactosamine-specific phosphotransferase system component IIB